jgi:hypothetical protein
VKSMKFSVKYFRDNLVNVTRKFISVGDNLILFGIKNLVV